ncbi:MAG: HEAT repeat domain-containing protein [Candidatus Binatia bacterium]
MRNDEKRPSNGFALIQFIPWVLSVLLSIVLAFSWLGGSSSGSTKNQDKDEAGELKTLQLALDISEQENRALRTELDRLLRNVRSPSVPPGSGGTASNATLAEQAAARAQNVRDLEERAHDALLRGTGKDTAAAIADLANLGPSAYPALEELYREASDPAAKRLLFPALMNAAGRTRGMEFVAEELKRATDPKLRGPLLLAASVFMDRKSEPELRDQLVQAVLDPNTTSGLRAAAVKGLQYSKGPEVEDALFAAASDPVEKVRLRAIERLTAFNGSRQRLRELIRQDPSPRIREVGACQLLIAEKGL